MVLYDDISDDNIKVDIDKLPNYFYIIQKDKKSLIPDYVFTDFKKFYDIYYILMNNEENEGEAVEVFPGKLPIKDGFLTSKRPFLKTLLNSEQESIEFHQKLFEGYYRPSDTMIEERLYEIENSLFEEF